MDVQQRAADELHEERQRYRDLLVRINPVTCNH